MHVTINISFVNSSPFFFFVLLRVLRAVLIRSGINPIFSTQFLLIPKNMDLCSTGNPERVREGAFDWSPLSKGSSDSSGAGTCVVSDESDFLSELLGSDIGLCSDSNRLCSPCDHVIVEGQAARPPSREDAQSQRNQRNAIAARQNRLKKKQYVICLQTEIARLKAENTVLKSKCRDSDVTVAQLSNEVEYFKSVLANQSMLSSLLQKVPTIKEVKFPSFISCKREGAAAMNEDLPLAKKPALSGGVCLHVSQDVATLEFCSSCSKSASLVLS